MCIHTCHVCVATCHVNQGEEYALRLLELEANFLSIFLELEVVEYMSRYMVHVCVEGVQVYHLYCMWVYVFNV